MTVLSVIIPTYNRMHRLRQVIAAIECQDYPRNLFEVIIVSDGSTDGTHDYLQDLRTPLHLRVIVQPNSGPATARNRGVTEAQGKIVLFIDDDVVPVPQLISEHMDIHSAEPGAVVLGPMMSPSDFTMLPWVRWEQRMLMKQYAAMESGHWSPTARQFYTGNTSLARQLVVAAGGFDPAFRRAEDVELAYRLKEQNVKFIYNPHAVGYHYAERSFRSWLETPYQYGRNDVIFARDKQQRWLLTVFRKEFYTRHALIRGLVHICVGRAAVTSSVIRFIKLATSMSSRLGVDRIAEMGYSAIFNLRYYEGVADELGGHQKFFERLQNALG